MQLTLPSLVHTAILRAKDESLPLANVIPNHTEHLEKLLLLCSKLSREVWQTNTTNGARATSKQKWDTLCTELMNFEYTVEKCQSLIKKLFKNDLNHPALSNGKLLQDLLLSYESKLANGAKSDLSLQIFNMFADAKRVQTQTTNAHSDDDDDTNQSFHLPAPIEKQFTLRVMGKTTSCTGIDGPQFLRAILCNNRLRLCGAFSQDTTFY